MKAFFFCLSLLSCSLLVGQTGSLTGKVMDGEEKIYLPGAYVSIKTADGETIKTAVTEGNGRFSFNDLEPGKVNIHISFLGYKEYNAPVIITNYPQDIGSVEIFPEAQQLEQVEITEEVLPAQQIGDTTQYNAGAFKTNPDASAEDLIKKMPGVVVDQGKVQAQGEDVKEVLVDGKPFFGNDPNAALKNLPAEVIDKIQVFDRSSDQSQFTGFEDGETSKTINIITKVDMRNGQFGKIYGGYGTDDRYRAGASVNFFNGDSRLSLVAQTNNINQQNFLSEDLVGVMSSSGGRGRGRGRDRGRRGGGNVSDFLVNEQGGIAQTNAFGLNYSDEWGEKIEVSGSYFFNQSENKANTRLSQDYFTTSDFDQSYLEESQTVTDNLNHRFNMRLEYEINDNNSIILSPRLSFQQNEGLENTFGQTIQGGMPTSLTDYSFNSDLIGLNFSNRLLYRHRFEKRGRTISLSVNTGYNQKSGESLLFSQNIYDQDAMLADTLDQLSDLDQDGWEYSARAVYTEPIGEKGQLQLNYEWEQERNDSQKETYDFEENTQGYSLLNTPLSNTFNSIYTTHEVGTGYRYRSKEGLILNANVAFQYANLDNEQVFPLMGQLDRDFYNVLPSAFVRYRFSRQKNLMGGYRPRTSPPSISQLQDVVDNSNPLQLSTGNPDLKQNYTHNLFMRYSSTNTEKSTVFFAMLRGSYSGNYIANSTFIATRDTMIRDGVVLQQGGQLTTPINLGGYYNASSYVTYGLPLKSIKSNFNANLSLGYTRLPGSVNGRINMANNSRLGIGLVLSSNISEKVDFTISSRTNYNIVRNSVSINQNNEYINQSSELGFNWIFGNGFVFRTQVNHLLYTGLSEGFDQNYVLWNASFGKKFLKNQRGEISLQVFDLLKQNVSVTRNVTDIYIEDVQTDVLQQYFMLTFTYNIRNFGKGSEAGPPENDRRRFGPPGGRRWDD